MTRFFIIGLLFSFACINGQNLNRKDFFASQDLVFDSLSNKWEEGAFIGNGLLGVMLYRYDANTLRFELGRTDVVDYREGMNANLGRCRLPIGQFLVRFSGKLKETKIRMDIWNGEISGKVFTDKGEITIQALVVATKDVIIINTKSSSEEEVHMDFRPEICQSPVRFTRDSVSKYEPNPKYIISQTNDIQSCYQALLVGGSHTTAWKVLNKNNGEKSAYITISNSYPKGNSKQTAEALIREVVSVDQHILITEHRDKWNRYLSESFLSIPDKRLENYYWAQQYKLASATRPGARPIDLMGPWYKHTPWPKYWWNLNIQLTYYPVFSSNHLELAQPLLKALNDNMNNLINNCPEPYRYNSAALGRSGPYEMTAGIKALKGNDSLGSSPSSLELGNLTWLLHVCWQAYEYSYDREVMENLYPILTRSINYYLNIMDKGTDGKWHLPYTYSPEYPKGITRDANYDLSLLRWGCKTLLYMNDQLKKNDPLAVKWKDVLDNLTPYPADQFGYRIGRDASFTISHRHYSHLLMVYPIYEINWDQPENRPIIEKSLNQWETNNQSWRGYSYTGSGSIYAMMGNGDKTLKMLNLMIDKGRYGIKPNTMYTEAGPVIETPLSAVNTINEMLLQDWNGVIRAFPALPSEWKDAAFENLRAKGAFLVSGVYKNGEISFIRIKSLAGSPCLVKAGFKGGVNSFGSRTYKIKMLENKVIEIDLKKGEEIILYSGAKPQSLVIEPVPGDNRINYWGLKK